MFQNYLRIALRVITRNKVYSAINIVGLSTGMAVALLIGLWVHYELSFNTSFANYSRIGRIMRDIEINGRRGAYAGGPYEIEAELRSKYGQYFKHIALGTYLDNHVLAVGEKTLRVSGEYMGEEIPQLLSLELQEGDARGLHDPSSIFLSASAAKALFGNSPATGQTLKMDSGQLLQVRGVYTDLPANTDFKGLGFIASSELYNSLNKQRLPGNPWRVWNLFDVYVQLADGVDWNTVSEKIRYIRRDKMDLATFNADKQYQFAYPMPRWHLYDPLGLADSRQKIQYVWLMGIIGLFVLLLACINFMNLATARSERRAKEVGIRKTIGSLRSQIVGQFFSESLIAVAFSLLLGLCWAQLLLPVFNNLTDKQLTIPWLSLGFWGIILVTGFFTGIVAGLYPALYLSSFRPIETLKSAFRVGPGAAKPRKALIVLQFTVSISLIIGTMIVYRQIRYGQQRPVGYDRNGLVLITSTPSLEKHFQIFRQELRTEGLVVDAALGTSTPMGMNADDIRFDWKGRNPKSTPVINIGNVTPEYGRIIGWQLKAGRDFDPALATNSAAFILNESAAQMMGFRDPVGQTVLWRDKPFHIIGVIRDILSESPYQVAVPCIWHISGGQNNWDVVLRVNPSQSMSTALARIGELYSRYEHLYPMEYFFVDQEYAKKFGDEVRIGRLSLLFTVLAVLISGLGLFGMASYMAEQRSREIGIRKVLGASVSKLWLLLTREFLILVTIALLVAGPLAWLGMHEWLQQFPYRTGIDWWVFVAAGAGAIVITLATVSYQTVKAALTNPIRSLRTE